MGRTLAPLIFIITCLFTALAHSQQQLPTEAFASKPDVDNVKLSPDGKHAASLVRINMPDKKGTAINLFNLIANKASYPVFVDDKKYVITNLRWANDKMLLITAKFASTWNGTPISESRLLTYDLAEQKLKALLPASFLKRLRFIPNVQSNIVDILPDDPNYILLQIGGHEPQGEPAVVKVSLYRGGNTHYIQAAQKGIFDWITDRQGEVKIAVHRDDTKYTIMYVPEGEDDKSDFTKLWSFEAFSAEQVWPLGFAKDPNILYVRALHEDKDAIFKVNLASQDKTLELVMADSKYDIASHLKYSYKIGDVIGAGERYWHPDYINFKKAVNKALPNADNYIVSTSRDENHYIVLSTSDTEAGMYILGNREKSSMSVLAYRYKHLTPDVLAQKTKISYKARDGLQIEGYLTLPLGETKKKLPTIIFPHGGPISYDDDGFDYWTQFLANRGYAVLQMNFRGSYGYGFNFMSLGIASWGQAMQDDVEDGTRWIIEEGIADPNKICILGASYGGYAALMGAVKTPDLYKCAVSFGGVTDVEYLVKSTRRFTNHDIVKKQVGDDYDKLWEHSPLKHAKKIKIPVLLIHGEKDRVVRAHHSEEMYDELQDEDKDVQYIELEDGDHYLSNAEHRLTTFKAIERFLQKVM
ncbi:alpha/beta hydrolase family protein [Catenovulum sediminis]|uniref:S9 family peptidase n=1 Tax=Catenovulum sediminis TaxID=1740262 RepID=A0ABV1RKK9_9ALTE|nr:S9 family peptidase [Catenovulum sediminis]